MMVNRHPGEISIVWIIPQFFLVSCSEILLSVTGYEFAYTQAPASMKGFTSAMFLLTVSLGNALLSLINLVSFINRVIQDFALAGILLIIFLVFSLITRNHIYVEPKAAITVNEKD
jgi:dipeptide/tripeptide permease